VYGPTELGKDVWYAWRCSTRRGYRLVALFTILTVGFGTATASSVFSVAEALLVRNLRFPGARQLVSIELFPAVGSALYGRTANQNLLDVWRHETSSMVELAGFQGDIGGLRGNESAEPVQVIGVTTNMMALLGARSRSGREFVQEDDVPGANPVVILSYALSKQRFGGSGNAIGQVVVINGRKCLVIGVMPPQFHVPLSVFESPLSTPEVWTTLDGFASLFSTPRGPSMPIEVIGRTRPGVNRLALEYQLENAGAAVEPALKLGGIAQERVRVTGLKDALARSVRMPLVFLLLATALLLALMCLNITNLRVADVINREREISTKVALGAPRPRLLLQSVVESAVMPLIGGALGFLLSLAAVPRILHFGASFLPPDANAVPVGVRVFVFSLVLALGFGVVGGVWPMLTILRRPPAEALGSQTPTGGSPVGRGMRVLAVFEIALATILMMTMGLSVHGFVRLTGGSRGFDVRNVVMGGLILPDQEYPTEQDRQRFALRLLDNLKADRNITSAALSSGTPILGGTVATVRTPNGRSIGGGVNMAVWRVLGPYFTALGVPIIRGTEPDFGSTPSSVAVDEAAAKALFGSQNPVGRRILWGKPEHEGIVSAVVGTTDDFLINVSTGARLRSVRPHVYVSGSEEMSPVIRIVARAAGNDDRVLRGIRESVGSIDHDLVVDPLQTVQALMSVQLARERFLTMVITAFAILAVVVGGAGLFALMFYLTVRRRHEVAVRLVLGALPGHIVVRTLREGLLLTGVGNGIGILGAFGFYYVMRSLFFGVSPLDLPTLAGVIVFSFVISLAASLLPAARAATVDATAMLLRQQ
jgi:putative ABC transport system permease protein